MGGEALRKDRVRTLARSLLSDEGGSLASMHGAGLDAINHLERNSRVVRTSVQEKQREMRHLRRKERRESRSRARGEKGAESDRRRSRSRSPGTKGTKSKHKKKKRASPKRS